MSNKQMNYVMPNDHEDEDDDVLEGGDEIVDVAAMDEEIGENYDDNDGVDDGDSDVEEQDHMDDDNETAQ